MSVLCEPWCAVGKLAAVWPLLGIVLEAVVLCVIIVIHERKRARQRALAETDADNDNKDTAATNRLYVTYVVFVSCLISSLLVSVLS